MPILAIRDFWYELPLRATVPFLRLFRLSLGVQTPGIECRRNNERPRRPISFIRCPELPACHLIYRCQPSARAALRFRPVASVPVASDSGYFPRFIVMIARELACLRRWVLFENYDWTNGLERCCRLRWHRSSGVFRLGALLVIGVANGVLTLSMSCFCSQHSPIR